MIWLEKDGLPYRMKLNEWSARKMSGADIVPSVGKSAQRSNVPIESPPPLMDQALQSSGSRFGPVGKIAADVPGIVTTEKGASDPLATREAAGQRAYEGATPDQQARFNKMRQDQQIWTSAFGKPARAGYYYGPNGQELAMSDRVYKGEAEQQRVINYQIKAIDDAVATLKKSNLVERAAAGSLNYGEIGQAFADLDLASTGPVYALSGKQTTQAEMKMFARTFTPQPNDSWQRIEAKTERLKAFYEALSKTPNGQRGDVTSADIAAAYAKAREIQETNPAQQRLKNKYGLE